MSKTFIDIIGEDEYKQLSMSGKMRLNRAMRVAKNAIESKGNELIVKTYGPDEKTQRRKFKRDEVEKFIGYVAHAVIWRSYEIDEYTDKKRGNCVYLTRGLNNEDIDYMIDEFMKRPVGDENSNMISDKEIMSRLNKYEWMDGCSRVKVYVGTKKVCDSWSRKMRDSNIGDVLIDMISDYAIKGMSISSVGQKGYSTEIRFHEKPKSKKWDEETNCSGELIEFIEAWKVINMSRSFTNEQRMEEYAKHSWGEVGKDVFREYDKRNSYYRPKWAFIDA